MWRKLKQFFQMPPNYNKPLERHFTTYVEEVKQLMRENKNEEALSLLYKLVEATEAESAKDHGGVAPWYYEQIAIIYRKLKRYSDEVAILERYDSQQKAAGVMPTKLAERLLKARLLLEKSKTIS